MFKYSFILASLLMGCEAPKTFVEPIVPYSPGQVQYEQAKKANNKWAQGLQLRETLITCLTKDINTKLVQEKPSKIYTLDVSYYGVMCGYVVDAVDKDMQEFLTRNLTIQYIDAGWSNSDIKVNKSSNGSTVYVWVRLESK